MKRRVAILGSTGSIGTNTLDVISRHPEKFEVFALSGATQIDLMLAQCERFKPTFAVMASDTHAAKLEERLSSEGLATRVIRGPDAISQIASHEQVDTVMAAIVGAAGLASCIAAAKAGKQLLLANKEALVVGSEVFLKAVEQGGATMLPIDSEHSAIFQSLPDDRSSWSRQIEKIILTASGGPFRNWKIEALKDVTPDQACAHPNWVMGRKISVDSATMMNKALEVIEAKYLFGVGPSSLEVVIHPQSIIHSMVQYRDTSVVAQLGTPDMRVPIAFGLAWPERMTSGAAALDFRNLPAMTFEAIDSNDHAERFPGLALAWRSLDGPAGTCAVLNAANEVAVAAFLERKIRFDQIHRINLETLDAFIPSKPETLEDLLALDADARACAESMFARIAA